MVSKSKTGIEVSIGNQNRYRSRYRSCKPVSRSVSKLESTSNRYRNRNRSSKPVSKSVSKNALRKLHPDSVLHHVLFLPRLRNLGGTRALNWRFFATLSKRKFTPDSVLHLLAAFLLFFRSIKKTGRDWRLHFYTFCNTCKKRNLLLAALKNWAEYAL